MRIGSDRRYDFYVSPEAFWSAASRTASFRTWWPWLQHFDAPALAEGEVWSCCVQPPLPYAVNFTLHLFDVQPNTRVQARVTGDVEGEARLDVEPAQSGCRVRLRSSLTPSSPLLKTVAVIAWPVVVFGHNWVLDTGARQFLGGMARTTLAGPGLAPGSTPQMTDGIQVSRVRAFMRGG